MSQGTIMERIEHAIRQRADKQANREADAFGREVADLLVKHGVFGSDAKYRLAPEMIRVYTEARANRLRKEMELAVAQRILGGEAGGTQKV